MRTEHYSFITVAENTDLSRVQTISWSSSSEVDFLESKTKLSLDAFHTMLQSSQQASSQLKITLRDYQDVS